MSMEKATKAVPEEAGPGSTGEPEENKVLIGRRTFLKGIGIAATTTAVAGTGTLLAAPEVSKEAHAAVGPGVLATAPVVMMWRQVSDLDQCRRFVSQTSRLPELDVTTGGIIYDGGSLILGFASGGGAKGKDELNRPRPNILTEAYRPQPNPASTLMYLPADFAASHGRLKKATEETCSVQKNAQGENLYFADEDGNESRYYQPSRSAQAQPMGRKLLEIAGRCAPPAGGTAGDAKAFVPVDTPVVGLELLVSDLSRSTKFYSESLGLRVLSASADETNLDLGSIVLVLRPEPAAMLVEFLNRSGRLLGDWAVFRVPDLDQSVKSLEASGVKFPSGIESVGVGRVAYLRDPDGHSWVLWQPSGEVESVPYYPALARALASSGAR